jgi:dTDP-4-dehydrorhamnose 3,5-epimerase
MIFSETNLRGAYIIDIECAEDERGYFARTFCRKEFEERGLNPAVAQCSISYNRRKGTLRGLHYQAPPHAEAKVVTCLAGAVYDVIIDLRAESETFRRWFGISLSGQGRRRMVYVPEGFAHGFETLEDHSMVAYQIAEFYTPESARGIRWDDPAFAVRWPEDPQVISERDKSYPDFRGC